MEDPHDTQTVLRMAIGMCIADERSPLGKAERAYWITRLQVVDLHGTPVPLTPEEHAGVLPWLLTWADAYRESFGKMLRELLTGGETPHYIKHGTQLELVSSPPRTD